MNWRLIPYIPYTLFLVLVLAPVGAVSYALASIAGTVVANWRSGWRDHKEPVQSELDEPDIRTS